MAEKKLSEITSEQENPQNSDRLGLIHYITDTWYDYYITYQTLLESIAEYVVSLFANKTTLDDFSETGGDLYWNGVLLGSPGTSTPVTLIYTRLGLVEAGGAGSVECPEGFLSAIHYKVDSGTPLLKVGTTVGAGDIFNDTVSGTGKITLSEPVTAGQTLYIAAPTTGELYLTFTFEYHIFVL